MWFGNTVQKNSQNDVNNTLKSIMSNGIELSIEELLQYQNKTSLINLTAHHNVHGRMAGNYLARSKGRGMEFDEVRHYQTGDDIRAIDWRVTARTGKTHTKLFREEIERPVLIATDLNCDMHFGSQLLFKSVQAAHLAALVAWHAKSRSDRIGGIVFNQSKHVELKPRSRKQGVLHYLHALTTIYRNQQASVSEPNDNQLSFEQNCARIRHLARPGSLVYLITDGHNITDDAVRHLSRINQHCELVVCLVTDPLEHQLPQSKYKYTVAITDGTNRQQLVLGDPQTASKYKQLALKITEHQQQVITKTGARILTFSAGETLENQLKNGAESWTR